MGGGKVRMRWTLLMLLLAVCVVAALRHDHKVYTPCPCDISTCIFVHEERCMMFVPKPWSIMPMRMTKRINQPASPADQIRLEGLLDYHVTNIVTRPTASDTEAEGE